MKIARLAAAMFGSTKSESVPEDKLLLSLLALAWVVEARDPYTGGHLWRVSRFASLLARRVGLSEEETWTVSIGGFLHDLGKIAVPDAVLRKTDRLTDEEYAIIQTHPEVGRALIADHPLGSMVMDAVYSHHERPDGKGYPQGLTKEAIPRASAIIGICDAFDAMTSNRPYRKGMPVEKALSIINVNLGVQFDDEFGQAFLQLGNSRDLHHIVGHSDEGIPLQHCRGCGPTIVIRRGAALDTPIFCPACGTGYEFKGFSVEPEPSGKVANARNLRMPPDTDLIAGVIRRTHDAV
ncbi:HD-GYP domain-containing protein [Paraburkholderia caribensis]|nr:HD-GYP domain-containing protein [Paraburkholderia caribensis]